MLYMIDDNNLPPDQIISSQLHLDNIEIVGLELVAKRFHFGDHIGFGDGQTIRLAARHALIPVRYECIHIVTSNGVLGRERRIP